MRAPIKMFSLIVTVNLALACGAPTSTTSDTKHDEDEPTRGVEAWMWADVSDAQYKTHIAPLVQMDASDLLPANHALVKRVQMWLDLIDAKLRAEHGDDLALTPKPRAQVIKQRSSNAFVAPVPVCYDLAVKVGPGSVTSASTANVVYLDNKTGELSEWPTSLKCLTGTDSIGTMKRFAQTFNANASGSCSLTVTGSSSSARLVPSDGCARNADIDGINAAKSVAIMQTANHVTVFTGLFATMTEPEFVAVLSHELGHYYRSHATGAESQYDFFYEIPAAGNVAARPTANESLRQLGQTAVVGSTLLLATERYRAIPNQKIRPELFFTAGSIVTSVCAAGDCPTQCQTAATFMATDDFKDAIGLYPFGSPESGETAAYKLFESKALACLEKLSVDSSTVITADSVSWEGVVALTLQPAWPGWLSSLPAGTQQMLRRYAALTGVRLGDTTTADDLAAAMKNSSAEFNGQDDEGEAALQQAYSRRLGYYTFEQEADEEAAEWMADIGFNPKSAVTAMQALGRGQATALRGMSLGEGDCSTLFDNDWTNANGSAMFVPVGDYSEIHHSACFRMYNIDREIKAHGHVASGATLPQHGGQGWLSLQTQATTVGDTESVSGGIGLLPIVKQTGFARCLYAQSTFL